jgi:hypothetical protein
MGEPSGEPVSAQSSVARRTGQQRVGVGGESVGRQGA